MRIPTSILATSLSLLAVTPAVAEDFHYVCADGTKLTVTFIHEPASANLVFEGKGEHIALPQVPSADGGRYAAGNIEFWIKGKDATLTRGESRTTCKQ